jgi:hypothetical protein
MEQSFIAVIFAAIAGGLGWYVRRSVLSGAIGFAIREDEQFWFARNEDPFSFWIAVSFAIFLTLLAMIISIMLTVKIIFLN